MYFLSILQSCKHWTGYQSPGRMRYKWGFTLWYIYLDTRRASLLLISLFCCSQHSPWSWGELLLLQGWGIRGMPASRAGFLLSGTGSRDRHLPFAGSLPVVQSWDLWTGSMGISSLDAEHDRRGLASRNRTSPCHRTRQEIQVHLGHFSCHLNIIPDTHNFKMRGLVLVSEFLVLL